MKPPAWFIVLAAAFVGTAIALFLAGLWVQQEADARIESAKASPLGRLVNFLGK
jgi:hypothetical protein